MNIRSGSTYTLAELAPLAKKGLETYDGGISHRRAVEILNEHYPTGRGRYHAPQISQALNDPDGNPGMVLLLIEAFTDYTTDRVPRYKIERKG